MCVYRSIYIYIYIVKLFSVTFDHTTEMCKSNARDVMHIVFS